MGGTVEHNEMRHTNNKQNTGKFGDTCLPKTINQWFSNWVGKYNIKDVV